MHVMICNQCRKINMDKPRVPSACCVWYSGQGLTIVGPGNCYQNAEGKSYEATHDSGIFSCWGFSMHKVFFDLAATIARLIPPPPPASRIAVVYKHLHQKKHPRKLWPFHLPRQSFYEMDSWVLLLSGCHFSSSPSISLLHLARTLVVLDRTSGNMGTSASTKEAKKTNETVYTYDKIKLRLEYLQDFTVTTCHAETVLMRPDNAESSWHETSTFESCCTNNTLLHCQHVARIGTDLEDRGNIHDSFAPALKSLKWNVGASVRKPTEQAIEIDRIALLHAKEQPAEKMNSNQDNSLGLYKSGVSLSASKAPQMNCTFSLDHWLAVLNSKATRQVFFRVYVSALSKRSSDISQSTLDCPYRSGTPE